MEPLVQETKVLAIASHVVYGHVGNTMAAFVMQALGCDVAALNTVQFSNHTGYKQFKGTRTTVDEISEIYAGLKQSYLTDFDVLLSGYAPSAEAVEAIGAIAQDLEVLSSGKPGSFFWVLDPVMGDEGRLYVNQAVVPVYRKLLNHADLILPNQFEAELLSETKIGSHASLRTAISTLHARHLISHVIVTSIRFPHQSSTMSIVGSTATSSFQPRIFRIDVPTIDCFFSGTGDLFAALTVVRLREAVDRVGLTSTHGWVSPDDVLAADLPLAKAVEKVLGSMQAVLEKTMEARSCELEPTAMDERTTLMMAREDEEKGEPSEAEKAKRLHLRKTKAAEVRVTRCLDEIRNPKVEWKAVALEKW